MRQQGRLTEWNDDRGFGFIEPLDGGPKVFVHISAFPHDARRPLALDLVTYALVFDERGRRRADEVQFLAPTYAGVHSVAVSPQRARSGPSRSFVAFMTLLLLAVFVGVYAATAAALRAISTPAHTPAVTASAAGSQTTPATSAPAVVVPSKPAKKPTAHRESSLQKARREEHLAQQATSNGDAIAQAFQSRSSGIEVVGAGVVARVLADDNDGSRHQRFILRLPSGTTLLIAHNIDIAPRLANLDTGDTVAFKGQYEWNAQGGLVHWTHHDPSGEHAAGWLKHEGQTVQ